MEEEILVTKQVTEKIKFCDECKKQIEDYGNRWYELKCVVNPFRDDCGEANHYHFDNYECLAKFIKRHKSASTYTSELEKVN